MRSGSSPRAGVGRFALALVLFALAAPARAATTVVLPMNAGPDTVSLSPAWRHSAVDVGLVIDATGSMGGEVTNLKAAFSTVFASLQARYPDLRLGVASFEDWPCDGHGDPLYGDLPYRLLQRCTSNTTAAQNALNVVVIRNGLDLAESGYDAIFQAVTGAGAFTPSCGFIPAFDPSANLVAGVADGASGGMGFRPGAARVLAVVTDSYFHESFDYAFPGPASRDATLAALQVSGDRFVALLSDVTNTTATAQLRELCTAATTNTPPAYGTSPTMCETGIGGATVAPVSGVCPNVFGISGSGTAAGTALDSAVTNALDASPFTLSVAAAGVPLPPGGTSADFATSVAFTGGTNPAFAPSPFVSGGGSTLSRSYATGGANLRVVLENLTVASGDTVQRYPLVLELRAAGALVGRDTIVVEIPFQLSVPPGTPGGGLRLLPSARNPFATRFATRLVLPEAGSVRVVVCDAAGRLVRTLARGELSAGLHALEWDGTRDDGGLAPAGLYFVRAAWRDQRASLRITRLR